MRIKLKLIVLFVFVSVLNANCQSSKVVTEDDTETKTKKKKKKKKKFKLPEIDLTHWKVTTPAGDGKKPQEVSPPEIMDYATNEALKPYMYNDSTRGAIVFYAFPSKATTANTKYSRSELREQMVSGENNVNWTFKEGGYMKGKLAIDDISKDSKGKYHRVIIMQIHGRLTNEQRDLIGEKDNNAPPMLKIYWDKGKIRVKTKVLKNLNATPEQMLHEDAWGDDEGFNFEQEVGFRKFTLEVEVSDGKMVVILNKNEFKVYDNIHMKKWGIFENYFKAGNYLQTRDEGAFAKVRYYDLEVKH
ncbi:polysaccharide lyase family 7 protein [Olleya namhaensis]|uniref:Alginate lyase n=1 Tax=Olleya namhaensis TaxID=1144750 RepID=A0A1I3SIB0_9FLAO|nr:polysaccharide lyase family 7 protein [Olleya namhaensis]SFJ57237.1 Alginate lyase [Olleya namhaensis]